MGGRPPTEPDTFDRLLERQWVVPEDSEMISVQDHLPTSDFLGGLPHEPIQARRDTDAALEPATSPLDTEPFSEEDDKRTDVWALPDAMTGEAAPPTGEESHIIGNRYRITEGLALGGMGAVFKVSHLQLQKEFALKIILTERAADQNMQKFFFREARVLSKLQHPNIVAITDFGHDDRFGAYLVMEYLHGESLFARLQREGRLQIGVALQIGLQLAEALDYMHSRALIHCDIKPENVFLCSDAFGPGGGEAVKLIDFGLSRSMVRGAKLSATEVGGTPSYAAPEQLAGRAPQPSMDIYGVGVLLYAMITGWPPFTGTVPEILEAKRTRDPERPSKRLNRRLDEKLESMLMRCLARDPAERPASMAQLIAELRGLLVRMGFAVPQSSQERHRPISGKFPTLMGGEPAFLQRCPMPMFVVDRSSRIQLANPAFCDVLETPLEHLVDTPLSRTRLGRIYPRIAGDLLTAAHRGLALLRRIEFKSRSVKRASIFIWLAPEFDESGEVQKYWGILMPL